uniref:AN1-type domain-containing protein n=1 Tax=viral metagenome TaxID=1070528 RepID=A0A6C0KB83_9ZZZZ
MNKRCSLPDCKKKLKTMRFECQWCSETFCLAHQIPEAHNCADPVPRSKADQAVIPAKISFI